MSREVWESRRVAAEDGGERSPIYGLEGNNKEESGSGAIRGEGQGKELCFVESELGSRQSEGGMDAGTRRKAPAAGRLK